jgi:hypothetical protein
MALNIKNPETERLARELARRRGESITEAVTRALRKEVELERRKPSRKNYEDFKWGIDAGGGSLRIGPRGGGQEPLFLAIGRA